MTTPLTPNLNSSGSWNLTAPFAALLTSNVSYKCVAIRSLSDLIAAGADPYSLYYSANGLTQADYQADVTAGASIVSLQSSSGSWVYVPTTYISQMPGQNNISCTSIVLGVNLGPLPDSLDLTFVKTQVANAVTDSLGVSNPTVVGLAVSAKTLISSAEAAAAAAARQAVINSIGTPTAQLIAAQKTVTTQQTVITSLSEYIQTLITSGVIPSAQIPVSGSTPTVPTVTAMIDASVLPSGMTLDSTNMVVTSTENAWQTARTTYAQSIGLYYAEATITRLAGAIGFGLCNQSEAADGELGADSNGIMMFNNIANVTSGVFYLGGVVDTIGDQAPPQGTTVGIAANLTLGLVWFWNPVTQQWNGDSLANQDPAGSVGGIDITSICRSGSNAVQVYPAISLWQLTDSVTYNPGSSAFSNTIPDGYSAWNTDASATVSTGSTTTTTQVATLDPVNSGTGGTLSNSNLTFTSSGGWLVSRSTNAQNAGKYYFEVTVNNIAGGVAIGVANGLANLGQSLGLDANSIIAYDELTYEPGSGIFANNAYVTGTMATEGEFAMAAGAVIGVAVDLTNELIWFWNPATSQWNCDVIANQDPSTGAGGISIGGLTGVAYNGYVYAAVSCFSTGDSVTANLGAAGFTNPLPAGFSAWDTLVLTVST
ncbi:hypothetical protein [Paraburkholderia sp. BCC1886]|uniref:DUF7194 family protein n=1 Tax=Paraburkholderia sp. BCC1886 TaxID=2562670 RepID=UPI0011826D58|nr:hypothetical protein [Paraburkholderia sp. BCC1886]